MRLLVWSDPVQILALYIRRTRSGKIDMRIAKFSKLLNTRCGGTLNTQTVPRCQPDIGRLHPRREERNVGDGDKSTIMRPTLHPARVSGNLEFRKCPNDAPLDRNCTRSGPEYST